MVKRLCSDCVRTRACQVMERSYRLLARSVVNTIQVNSRLHGTPPNSCFGCWLCWIFKHLSWSILKNVSCRIHLRASLSVSTVLSLVLLAVLRPLSHVKGLACARDKQQWKQVIKSVIHIFIPNVPFAFSYYAHIFHAEYGLRFRLKKK